VGEHIWAARLSAAFILGLEVSFPAVLVWRRLQPLYALAAAVLHVGTWFLLGLDYWAWAITVPLLLVDWPASWGRGRGWWRRRRAEPAELLDEPGEELGERTPVGG
jgi:hypothetical protein